MIKYLENRIKANGSSVILLYYAWKNSILTMYAWSWLFAALINASLPRKTNIYKFMGTQLLNYFQTISQKIKKEIDSYWINLVPEDSSESNRFPINLLLSTINYLLFLDRVEHLSCLVINLWPSIKLVANRRIIILEGW